MISTSDSLNRVKIISVILKTKLSQAFSFHSHSELVSPHLSSPAQYLFMSCPPSLGHSHPGLQGKASVSQVCSPSPELPPELPTHLSNYSWTFLLFYKQCAKSTHQDLVWASKSTLGLMGGWVLWHQVRRLYFQ